jgi:NAD(P)-dependent dehydrogenase (short-subunit alcohol dehydrogenase family)
MVNPTIQKTPLLPPGALEGKIVFITGGGTGLGRSMAVMLGKAGAKLVIASRKADVIEKAADEMAIEANTEVLGMVCDVRQYDQIEAVLDAAKSRFGAEVNVLINNAAGNFISPTEQLSHRAFETVVDIVLKGSINCTLACGKRWIAQGIAGNVLSIVTTYAWTGTAYTVPSATGKAGVLALMQSLAVEWGPNGIRCNSIAPGPFPTEGAWSRLFPQGMLPPEVDKEMDPTYRIPLQRVGEHEELANLAAFMVSDYAAYLNGACITLDGGEWLQGAGQFSWARHIPKEMWPQIAAWIRGKPAPQQG